jgi:hypothetical protein
MNFRGYVIANGDEEYLVEAKERGGVHVRAWSRLPGQARRFSSRQLAWKAVRKMGVGYPLYVLELHESATQFMVATDEAKRPSWLATAH